MISGTKQPLLSPTEIGMRDEGCADQAVEFNRRLSPYCFAESFREFMPDAPSPNRLREEMTESTVQLTVCLYAVAWIPPTRQNLRIRRKITVSPIR
jgi:hypothetical protein